MSWIRPSKPDGFEQPVPWEPKSPSRAAQIRAQNRRREYLVRNTTYFDSLEHELADPVLYARLVKRFQTPAEREAEGKAKGYGRTLEAALERGESKVSGLPQSNGASESTTNDEETTDIVLDKSWTHPATDKIHGQQQWHDFLEDRFVHGEDEDFDYSAIDRNDEFDTLARKDAEDAWFDDEEPSWVEDVGAPNTEKVAEKRDGETGVQDY
ncbi:coiled-coil domain-containing protein-domain-containing protein [Dactylonectria estremocensis]|uniref:Coiled-coil domain-containing protein-domain-containing protein n=1 Tax=Dactylonectria estremocensis TaxID=1079267 RepID=A0A9P9FCY1_9HYPO|nr:coiled-coil domain-containing protein-domain-containing protein [Dactylonectria estremocensis]